jgi:hypothetical protein
MVHIQHIYELFVLFNAFQPQLSKLIQERSILNAQKALEISIKLKETASKLYQTLALIYKDDKYAKEIWRTLSKDKALQGKFFSDELIRLKDVPAAYWNTSMDLTALTNAHTLLLEKKKDVNSNKKNMTLTEALDISIEIEEKIIAPSYIKIIPQASPALKMILREVVRGDKPTEVLRATKDKIKNDDR